MTEFIKLVCVKTCCSKTMTKDYHFIENEIYYMRGACLYDKDKKIMIDINLKILPPNRNTYFKIFAEIRDKRINEILNG